MLLLSPKEPNRGRLTCQFLGYGNTKPDDRESSAQLCRNKGDLTYSLGAALASLFMLSACQNGVIGALPGIYSQSNRGGIVVADEPQAVLVAKNIIDTGGSAADAAVALGLALSVTYQSAAGIGGGGLCTIFDAASGRAEALSFTPEPALVRTSLARWQVSVPALPRGLFALHAKYGKLPWQSLVIPAENLARFGAPVTRAFAEILASSSDSLVNDPDALDSFTSVRRTMLKEGDRFIQLDMAALLGRIRGRTPGDFYSGSLAITLDQNAFSSGSSLGAEDLRAYSPRWTEAHIVRGQRANFHVNSRNIDLDFLEALLLQDQFEGSPIQTAVPASTGFVVADANGNVVACTLTMIEPFGVGIMLERSGFLLAPSVEHKVDGMPPLISLIAVERSLGYVTFAAAAGGKGAASRLAEVAIKTLANSNSLEESYPTNQNTPRTYSSNERTPQVNAFACERGLSANLEICSVSSDPLGLGYGTVTFGDP